MELRDYDRMDPNMLYSIINMKLRNEYRDLDELTRSLDLDRTALEQRLAQAGFHYDASLNQFRPNRPGA